MRIRQHERKEERESDNFNATGHRTSARHSPSGGPGDKHACFGDNRPYGARFERSMDGANFIAVGLTLYR